MLIGTAQPSCQDSIYSSERVKRLVLADYFRHVASGGTRRRGIRPRDLNTT